MREVTFLLRMCVFVGALLLLLSSPRGDRWYAQGSGSCINPVSSQASCPSGCTDSTFNQYTAQPANNGVFYLDDNGPAPCGNAKQGESCSPPLQYYPVGDFSDCFAGLGVGCTGVGQNYMNCCDSTAQCVSGVCCLPDGQSGCDGNNDYCCSGDCEGSSCQSSGGGGGGGGGGCTDDGDCPPDRCCNDGNCGSCMGSNGIGHTLDRVSSPKPPKAGDRK